MANKEEAQVWGFWVSPFVRRVEWALKLKGVDYEYIEEAVYNKKSPQFLSLHPVHKKAPLFVHDGKVIAESLIILEYIDETWKQYPLLPQDPHERATARFWAKFADEKIFEAGFNAMCFLGEEKEKAIKQAIEALEKVETELKGKTQFFGGEKLGYLDIAMGWIAHWLPSIEAAGSMKLLDPIQFPALCSWMNKISNHPVIKYNLPPNDKMLAFLQNRRQVPSAQPHVWIRF